MKTILIFLGIAALAACRNGSDSNPGSTDSTAINQKDTSIILDHFAFSEIPDSLSGCSEYYAFDTAMIKQQNSMILYTDLGRTAMMKINGRLVFLKMTAVKEHEAILSGEGYIVRLRSTEIKQSGDEVWLQDADIEIERNGNKRTFHLHGETGC